MTDRYTRVRTNQIENVLPDDLDATNGLSDNYIPSYDLATGKFTWVAKGSGTLDESYDYGGAGVGRQINVDNGSVKLIHTDTSDHCLEININAVLGATKYGLYVYSNQVQVNSDLVSFIQDNANSTQDVVYVQNDSVAGGRGIVITTQQNTAIYININDVLDEGHHGIYIRSTQANINADSALVKIIQDNASSTEPCIEIQNDGSGNIIEATQGYIKIASEYVTTSDGTTGGTGSAGSGNQYVELNIHGTIYKILHDGTV